MAAAKFFPYNSGSVYITVFPDTELVGLRFSTAMRPTGGEILPTAIRRMGFLSLQREGEVVSLSITPEGV